MNTLDVSSLGPRTWIPGGILVYPRIHCFSLDLSEKNGFMKHGSFGFSIYNLPITIKVKKSYKDSISIDTNIASVDYFVDFNKLRSRLDVGDHWEVSVECNNTLVRNHIGIGTSTQVSGGVMLACAKSSGRDLTISDLFELGVGGTSTLGLKLLFNPGMMIETGLRDNRNLSTAIYDISDFPFFTILSIPKIIDSISGRIEDAFYDDVLPETKDLADKVAYEVFERMIPAVVEEDIELFLNAISTVCNSGVKTKEESIQSKQGIDELARLRSLFGFAAISSVGPTIYSFSSEDPTRIIKSLHNDAFEYIIIPPRWANRYE